MSSDPSALATAIGARVKQERRSRGWTLDRLADTAGVSRRMLVHVEQGAVNPSIGTLLRISDALGVGLPALVEPPQHERLAVTRSGEGAILWRGEAGGRAALVAATDRPDVLELWDWTLGPGDRHTSEAHAPGTRELLHVQEGSVTVETGVRSVELGAGDAVAFPGDVPHAYMNRGEAPARFSLAVSEPGTRSGSRSEVSDV